MSYILIENKGEINAEALILMGGSSKTQKEGFIGKWGSGNKYSIATLLRNNINFKIFSGDREIKIETEKVDFRGISLEKIIIDNRETSLTTNMGHDWLTWFAIREMLSNSIDEGEHNIVMSTDEVNSRSGYTRIYIEHNLEIQNVIDEWDNYFTSDRVDTIYEKGQDRIFPNLHKEEYILMFRKGIRCYEGAVKSLYHYDLSKFEINESRVISNDYSAKRDITVFLNNCSNETVILNILKNAAKGKYYEGNLSWESWMLPLRLSETWKTVIGDHRIIPYEMGGWFEGEALKYPCYFVQLELAKRIKKSFPEIVVYGVLEDGEKTVLKHEVELDKRKQFLLNECNRFFNEAGYSVEYPIKVVRFNDYDNLGLAEDKTIYLSEKLFDMGKREIAITIIEENEHLKSGYKDETRAFQQHIFNLFISQIEERIGFFL